MPKLNMEKTTVPARPRDKHANVEKVLSTVCWMEDVLKETQHRTGYGLEIAYRQEFTYPRPDGAGTSTSGLFDRYSRGDSAPCGAKLKWLGKLAPLSHRDITPILMEVMRQSTSVYFNACHYYRKLSPHIACKLYKLTEDVMVYGAERGDFYEFRPITHRLLTDLAVQGDEFSLACLLIMIAEERYLDTPCDDIEDDDTEYLQRRQQIVVAACHCLVFLLTLPRYRPVRTALVARIRQRFLDIRRPSDKKLLLDRYDFIGIAEAVSALKADALASGKLNKTALSQRRFYRDVLAGNYGTHMADLLSVPFETSDGMIHDALSRECFTPRAIELEVFRERKGHRYQIHFGKKATAIMKAGLADYWVETCPAETNDS